MGFDITEFDDILNKDARQKANENALEDRSQYRVIEKLTDAELVISEGRVNTRPFITQSFPQQDGALHITYGDAGSDLKLSGVYSAFETWTIDTQTGGHVHVQCNDIRKGLAGNERRKIDVLGSGSLVVHFTPQALEEAYMVEKKGMIFIQPLYTKGFIIRGNVKFACVSEGGELNEITLKKFLRIKHERVKAVAHSPIAQKPIQKLNGAQKEAEQMGKVGSPKNKKSPLRLAFDALSRDKPKPLPTPTKPTSGPKQR